MNSVASERFSAAEQLKKSMRVSGQQEQKLYKPWRKTADEGDIVLWRSIRILHLFDVAATRSPGHAWVGDIPWEPPSRTSVEGTRCRGNPEQVLF